MVSIFYGENQIKLFQLQDFVTKIGGGRGVFSRHTVSQKQFMVIAENFTHLFVPLI